MEDPMLADISRINIGYLGNSRTMAMLQFTTVDEQIWMAGG